MKRSFSQKSWAEIGLRQGLSLFGGASAWCPCRHLMHTVKDKRMGLEQPGCDRAGASGSGSWASDLYKAEAGTWGCAAGL